jgi:hypothetical protein
MDLTFPLFLADRYGPGAELAAALLLGVGFGFLLERAGFGSARRLTAVFYLYDMAVLKVMFTAIITAMIGLAALAAAGALDLSELWVTPTNVAAQLAGGLVFGLGFLVGGYCPGTSMVAAATGRIDAIVFAVGLVTGLVAYAELMPGVDVWIREHGQGDLTLPQVLGVPMGWLVLASVGVWIGVVRLVRVLERRFARPDLAVG